MRMLTLLLLVVLFTLGGGAVAVNVPEVRSLGFSPGGQYYAFEARWRADGSGFPYRELHVVNVPRNTYVARLKLGGQEWDGRDAQLDGLYGRQSEQVLGQFGIRGTQPGAVLYHRAFRAPIEYGLLPAVQELLLSFRGRNVRVRLDETVVPMGCAFADLLPGSERPVGLSVRMAGRTLQADRHLPEWRECAYAYRVEEVRVWGNRVVVLLRAFMPGFEGPDAWPMVVTGQYR